MEIGNNTEAKLTVFNEWIDNLSKIGEVSKIEPMLIRGVLEGMGANFEISEEAKKSLRKYSNKGKKEGLCAVWGQTQVEDLKKWVIEKYIPETEERVGREMHTLWDRNTKTYDNIKHSGTMAFFGELTAFAAGEKSYEDFKRLTENRIRKGKKWEHGDPYEPYKPSPNAGFPEDFPRKAIDRLNSTNKAL